MSQLSGGGGKEAPRNTLSCLPLSQIITSKPDSIEINVPLFQWWPLETELMEQDKKKKTKKKIVTTF